MIDDVSQVSTLQINGGKTCLRGRIMNSVASLHSLPYLSHYSAPNKNQKSHPSTYLTVTLPFDLSFSLIFLRLEVDGMNVFHPLLQPQGLDPWITDLRPALGTREFFRQARESFGGCGDVDLVHLVEE